MLRPLVLFLLALILVTASSCYREPSTKKNEVSDPTASVSEEIPLDVIFFVRSQFPQQGGVITFRDPKSVSYDPEKPMDIVELAIDMEVNRPYSISKERVWDEDQLNGISEIYDVQLNAKGRRYKHFLRLGRNADYTASEWSQWYSGGHSYKLIRKNGVLVIDPKR
jgi:hypothetical protein